MRPTPRPLGVTITTLLIALSLLAEVVDQISYFHKLYTPHFPDLRGILIVGAYIVVYKIVAATVLVFYWRGRDWALWAVLAEALLTLASLTRIRGIDFTPQTVKPLTLAEIALALFLLYYLNTRSTRVWFE